MNDRVQIQRDLCRFEKQANRYLMELNKEKCKDLHLQRSSDWLCNGPAEKEIAVRLCGLQAEYKPILCSLYT